MKIKKTIFLNAGHSITDSGAIYGNIIERDLNINIVKKLIPLLAKQGFIIEYVPDNLNLRKSIEWVNQKINNINDGLALSIHCNSNGGQGAETFYYTNSSTSSDIALKLILKYCEETGLMNRGAKPDTQAVKGYLGWIRKTKCWSTLIECGFIDNNSDMKYIMNNYDEVALGICKGVCSIYDVDYDDNIEEQEWKPVYAPTEKLKKQINILSKMIKIYQSILLLLKKRK